MEKLLLTVEEAAEILGVGRSTVYDMVRMRVLRSVKLGSRRRIPIAACQEMIDRLLDEDVL